MITRNDLNADAFDRMIRNDLIESRDMLEDDCDDRPELLAAFNVVIAYYSPPESYKE